MVVVEKGNSFPFCCWYWFLCNSIGLLLVKFVYRRVAEFTEYGDMSMMMQYLKDVQAVQKKTTELAEAIEFINMVHFLVNILLFKAWLLEVNIVRTFLTGDTILPCKTMSKYDIEFSRWCFLLILTEYEQITNFYSPWNNQKTIGFLMYRILRKIFLKRKLTFQCFYYKYTFDWYPGRRPFQMGADNLSWRGLYQCRYRTISEVIFSCCQMATQRKEMDGWSFSWTRCRNYWSRGKLEFFFCCFYLFIFFTFSGIRYIHFFVRYTLFL